jgi:hypothetical protein
MEDLDQKMRWISLIVSIIALSLMIFGFVETVVHGASLTFPGRPVLPLNHLSRLSESPIGLIAMSGGILLLGALPSIRVLLALGLYLRSLDIRNALASLVVLLELLLSIHFSI